MNFKELNLSDDIQKGIEKMGFVSPSPIQEKSIPVLLTGKDVIGQAPTGTGKTLAFGSVLLSKIQPGERVQAIILSPTRELALQIYEELTRIGHFTGLRYTCGYGGSNIEKQIRTIKSGVDIVIGTPGRVMDLMRRKVLKLDGIHYFVLDEADEMLNMGFIEDIETILSSVPLERQTILFSATMPEGIKKIASSYMKEDYEHIQIKSVQKTATTVKQYFYVVKNNVKFEAVCRVLDSIEKESIIIFCRTKRSVDELTNQLATHKFHVASIHGDIDQDARMRTLRRFKEKQIPILIATDVAARGIDVDHVSHVINYELPQEDELYIHRIGRTGRAGQTGIAYSFVSPREINYLRSIERKTKSHFEELKIPSVDDIFNQKIKELLEDVQHILDAGKYQEFMDVVKDVPNRLKDDVLAALLKMNYSSRLAFEYKDDDFNKSSKKYDRIFLNAGSNEKLNKTKVKDFLIEFGKIRKDDIGEIVIKRKFTFVDINSKVSKKTVKNCFNKKIKGTRIKLEFAKEVR